LKDEFQTAKDADALIILTEWNQFRNINLEKIKSLLKSLYLFDLKNIYEPNKAKKIAFR